MAVRPRRQNNNSYFGPQPTEQFREFVFAYLSSTYPNIKSLMIVARPLPTLNRQHKNIIFKSPGSVFLSK